MVFQLEIILKIKKPGLCESKNFCPKLQMWACVFVLWAISRSEGFILKCGILSPTYIPIVIFTSNPCKFKDEIFRGKRCTCQLLTCIKRFIKEIPLVLRVIP